MKQLNRRHVLRGLGTTVALPFLSAMAPAAGIRRRRAIEVPPRFVAICGGLGFHAPYLFPKDPGGDYELTPYLKKLADHRSDFTLFSGLSHPQQNGNNGHASSLTWLTSAPRPGLAGFKNTVSIDQIIAARHAGQTRLPFLSLTNSGASLSWTPNGVNIPGQSSPARLFRRLFIDGSRDEIASELQELRRGRSILDTVLDDARQLNRSLGPRDQHKLDEYFMAIRDLEKRIGQSEDWVTRPKPKVEYEPPQDVADRKDILARQRLMYDMIFLALQTDSTRAITFALGGMNAVPSNIPGVTQDWHNLSHHGKDDTKISELKLIEEAEFTVFAQFLDKLKAQREADRWLLDHTTILFGSNLGNASSHDWRNLPILVAGGGFRHGNYVAHDPQNNTPLANLLVALAQRMGVEIDRFGSSSSETIRGLNG